MSAVLSIDRGPKVWNRKLIEDAALIRTKDDGGLAESVSVFSFLREPIALLEDRIWLLSESQESRMMARFWSSWNARVAFIGDGDDGKNSRFSPGPPGGCAVAAGHRGLECRGEKPVLESKLGVVSAHNIWNHEAGWDDHGRARRSKAAKGKGQGPSSLPGAAGPARQLSPLSWDSPSSPSFSFPFGKSEAKHNYLLNFRMTNLVLYYKCEVLNSVVCFHDSKHYMIVNQSCLSC